MVDMRPRCASKIAGLLFLLLLLIAPPLLRAQEHPLEEARDELKAKLPKYYGAARLDDVSCDESANTFTYYYTIVTAARTQWIIRHKKEMENEATERFKNSSAGPAFDAYGTTIIVIIDDLQRNEILRYEIKPDHPHRLDTSSLPDTKVLALARLLGGVFGYLFGAFGLTAGGSALVWFLNVKSKLTRRGESVISGYFAGPLKNFTFASKKGDMIGIATGRFKYRYPSLYVGESVFDVENSKLEGNTLILDNGTEITFSE